MKMDDIMNITAPTKEKANILVLGTSGAGKSTLINAVIGREVAKVGSGKHVTEEMCAYESAELNFRLIDSRGFEYSLWNTTKTVKDMNDWMRQGLHDKKPRIHMLWFCVDATSKRFSKQTIKTVEAVKHAWKDVPMIVVLTKSFFIAEDQENIEMVRSTFEKVVQKTGMPVAILPVLAQAPKGEPGIVTRGIEELVEITEANLDHAVQLSDEAVKKYDLKCKRIKAQALTIAATTSGTIVGAIPIEQIPDAAILTPMETLLISAIAKIYAVDQDDDYSKEIIGHIIEAGTASMIAKTVLNQLKFLPGIANLAADVLNAIVAGAIVFGIGEATTVIMEKVYLGNIDRSKLDWVNDVVNEYMNKVVANLAEVIEDKAGNVTAKDVLKALKFLNNKDKTDNQNKNDSKK